MRNLQKKMASPLDASEESDENSIEIETIDHDSFEILDNAIVEGTLAFGE